MRLSKRHELSLYVTGGLLAASGAGWLICHYLLASRNEFETSPAEPWWLRLHGAAMLGFLIAFGALLPGHAARGWRLRMNHRTGVFLLTVVIVLTLTGYGLYYVGDDRTRPWISIVHWGVGLLAAGGFVVHVVLGKRGQVPPERGRAKSMGREVRG